MVPNSVTFDDLERRNGPNRVVFSPNSVALGAECLKIHQQRKCRPKNLVFSDISLMAILAGDHPQRER